MKAIVISSIPFTPSNRGIDIIAQALNGMGVKVTHLAFASEYALRGFPASDAASHGIEQRYLRYSLFGYTERIMKGWGRRATEVVIHRSVRNLEFDFSPYDLVVVESGKPVLLESLIPADKVVVYRQSDPMQLQYQNPILHEVEKRMVERADKVICIAEWAKRDFLYGVGAEKVSVIKNGFDVSGFAGRDCERKVCTQEVKRAIYLGYMPIRYDWISQAAAKCGNVEFHIVGKECPRRDQYGLKGFKNVVFHGPLPPSDYFPLVSMADFAIAPYENLPITKYMGFTSKYMMFMYFGLPIVSVDLYLKSDFPESEGLVFCSTADEFATACRAAADSALKPVKYNVDFEFYSKPARIKEYVQFFNPLVSELISYHPESNC